MKMIGCWGLRGTLIVLTMAVCVLMIRPGAAVAENLYPDPGFETTGEVGQAHNGERAGCLRVGARNYWGELGATLTVEPFARYRVTEWVKGSVGAGTFFAPHCYDWNSYEWAFVTPHVVRVAGEWTRVEATFVAPNGTMRVNALAYLNAENSAVWVDDVVVEKIAEAAEVMAEIEAKTPRTDDETQMLARWYIRQGRIERAADLMKAATGIARADIANQIALHIEDPAERRPYVVEMLAHGGPTWHEGMRRFDEIARGFGNDERLLMAVEALAANAGNERTVQAFQMVARSATASGVPLGTVAETMARMDRTREALQNAAQQIPADSVAAVELAKVIAATDEEARLVEARRESLGSCSVRIGGRVLTPQTHAIVVPNRATAQEEYAAREMRYHLELITGTEFPVLTERAARGLTPILVGKCRQTRRLAPDIDFEGLGQEGIHIRTAGPALILAGNERGVLYAVYCFLEDNLGCRWFTPDCATWPRKGAINVPELDRRYIPPLEFRMGDYPVARNGGFAARLRLNGDNHGMSAEQGGTRGVMGLAHTFAALCPPERYFDTHPEYFSLVGGKRQSGYAQLCLTNPDVLRICTEGVRRWIREHPDKKVFSVSQNDTHNYCECENCKAVAEEEGSQAGPVVRFCNAIADDIKDDYPDVAIETLAYQYTRKPPKITKPRPNVIICLCSIECCFIHPLGTDPFNRSFAEDIRGWNRICDRLWIWDYVINYAHSICPFPNLRVLKPNINFFINNGVKGIYEESCYFTKGSELQELRNYIMAKTLWDPTYDTERAIAEFCAAYYGPAAPHVRRYINLIHDATQQNPKQHVMIYTHPREYITPKLIASAQAIFDRAEASVKDDPVLLHRVQVARLPVLYAAITLGTSGAFTEKEDALIQQRGESVAALADEFERIARAEGVTAVREGGPDASLDAWLQSVPRRPGVLPIERIRNGQLEVSVLPALGGRIYRMRQVATGRDLLQVLGSETARIPDDGGYEEYSEPGYRSAGWSEVYIVKERGESSLVLEANLRNGLRLTRKLELDPTRPLLKITSTVTNDSSQSRTSGLRAHPEFAVTSTARATVRILGKEGAWRTFPLANPADPAAEKNVWLREDDCPAGKWAVVDEQARMAILNQFDTGQVSHCLLNWNGRTSRVNLELFAPERILAPGESQTIEHSYEVVAPDALGG